MVSKILLVRNVIQEVLGIQITPEDADTIIERIEALQAKEAVEHLRAPDTCPVCFGDQYLLHNDGLMHPCPACNGTGKRR